ncbi:MAG: PQQ-binding-like beta-propeller repeat protein, partial [Armatimonadota bacterium]
AEAAYFNQLNLTGDNVGNLVHNIATREPQAACSVNLDVPRHLSDVVMKCLAKAPEGRFQSFEELRVALTESQRRLIDEGALAGRGRVCLSCEYRTLSDAASCPICAGTFVEVADAPERAVSVPEPPSAEPEAAEPEPAVEEKRDPEAAAAHFKRGVQYYKAGELKRAVSELRTVVRLDPDHAKAQRGLREVEKLLREQMEARRAASPRIDWPMFRGNLARTGFTPEVVLPPLVERWQFEVGDWVWSSPAVAHGIAYVGGRIESGGMYGRLCAIETQSGKLVWEQRTGYEVNGSPTVAFDRVYVGFGRTISAFEPRTGEPLWRHPVRDVVASSPTIANALVIAGCLDEHVYCLEARTGRERWTQRLGGAVYSSPLVWDGLVYIGAADSRLYALDLATGAVRWTFEAGDEVSSSPTLFDEYVYVGARDGNIYAVGQKTGRLRWRFQTNDEVYSSPALAAGTLYVGSRDHRLYAIDAGAGEMKWTFETGDWVYSSPAVADETVYVGSYDGRLHAVDAVTGESVWEVELSGEVRSSPAIAQGALYVGTNDGRLYCFAPG